jgi:hypothetical protein
MIRLTSFVLAIACGVVVPARAQLFEIVAPAFSAFVLEDGNYTPVDQALDGNISRARLTHGLLCFSFTVIGGQQTIDYLQQSRRLDVNTVILGDQSETVTGLGISQQKWAANKDVWIGQFKQLGYFTIRTFMNTQKIYRDTIEIQIRDSKNDVVHPVAYGAVTYKATVDIVP